MDDAKVRSDLQTCSAQLRPLPVATVRAARSVFGKGNLYVMIGDQLQTDIKGALEFGLDSALVDTGIARLNPEDVDKSLQPTWYLDSFSR